MRYIDGETAHDVRRRMAAHVRRDSGLMRLGDGKIVGSVTDTASGVTVSADAELAISASLEVFPQSFERWMAEFAIAGQRAIFNVHQKPGL